MRQLSAFVGSNRGAVMVAIVGSAVAWFAFPFLIGLNGGVGVSLVLLVVVVTVGVYRLLSGPHVAWRQRLARGRLAVSTVAGIVVVALAIQAVPFGWDRSNPPVTAEPDWDSARTRELVVRACFDCHSNEVEYPWYSRVAPMSWAVQLHVDQGRAEVNYSEWDRPQDEAEESAETVIDGEMPPAFYTRFAHSDARLTDAELEELIAGLEATLGSEDREEREEDD